MKSLLSILLFWVSLISVNAQPLGIVESDDYSDIYMLFSQQDITVHFYQDNFAIVSGEYKKDLHYSLLEKDGFDTEYNYFIQYANDIEIPVLLESIKGIGEIIYTNKDFSIIKIKKELFSQFKPIKNDALIYFDKNEAFLADKSKSKLNLNILSNLDITSMVNEVNGDSIEATIEYLSSFSTRDCYSSEVVEALNWISDKFKSYGLNVTYQSLEEYEIPSFNVIATQAASYDLKEKEASEYVIVGAHADSRSNEAIAPGADDNASGIAGVLEIARLLSQNSFNRTIVYCAFSGEEYGLFGSKYFAIDSRENDKNIIGYVNLDMTGYRHSTQSYKTSLIYPSQAQDLADYYKAITAIYTPNLEVIDGSLSGGDSDHTSFNNQGYMGIFPFEDVNNYSPYIHTPNDVLGISVNSIEQSKKFTRAALATIASMASSEYSLSIDNDLRDHFFSIYPNPVSTDLNINFSGQQTLRVEVINILGEIVLSERINSSDIIDVSSLKTGTYFVKITSADYSSVKKCIVKRD